MLMMVNQAYPSPLIRSGEGGGRQGSRDAQQAGGSEEGILVLLPCYGYDPR